MKAKVVGRVRMTEILAEAKAEVPGNRDVEYFLTPMMTQVVDR